MGSKLFLHREFIPCFSASLKSHLSNENKISVLLQFSWPLTEMLYNQIGGGFEESACCLQETVLIMAVWKEREWTKQDNQQGGVQVKR